MNYDANLVDYVKSLAQHRTYTQIVVTLAIQSGYALPVAHRIVESVLNHDGNKDLQAVSRIAQAAPVPDIDTSGQTLRFDLGDAWPEVVFEQIAPRVLVLDGFMSPDECAELCAEAGQLMTRARVMSGTSDENVLSEDIRDADTAYMPENRTPLVEKIERRIGRLVDWPVEQAEHIQVQRYRAGGKYIPHFDFFQTSTGFHKRALEAAGQRVGTLIVYIKEPEQGGSTYLANLGIRVRPRLGSALFFNYPDPSEQSGTLHGGDPVLAGEKWILTKWFREHAFKPRPAVRAEGTEEVLAG